MSRFRFVLIAFVVAVPRAAAGQEQPGSSFLPHVVKRVALDPTTYAPAAVGWVGTRLDWQSSQIFFENGFVEENARFTISGRRRDTPIGYGAGNRKIFGDAIINLHVSVINNVTSRVIERLLVRRFPDRGKLVRTIGWIERSALASYWSHRLAAAHFRQWQLNERNVLQLGL